MAKAIPEETRQGVATDYLAGMSPKEIKDKYNIGESTVYNIISSMKMSELTEKEPAPAATETDSQKSRLDPMYNDTTSSAESQALEAARKKLLAIYETLTPEETRAWELGEVYAEVVRGLGE
jgi:transposase